MAPFGVVRLGYVANLGIAAFLGATAWAVASRLRIPGRGPLAAYLALVAFNYGVDAVATLGGRTPWQLLLYDVGYVASAFDPPLLSAFALAFAGARLTPARWALLLAPSLVFLAHAAVVVARGEVVVRELGGVMTPILVGHYLFALVVVAHAHHASRTEAERDLRAAVVPALALIVLPRLPLVAVDLRWVTGPGRDDFGSLLFLELPLLLTTILGAALFLRAAPPEARASARRVVRNATALLAVVACVWMLRFTPGFSRAAYALLYSVRWVVFAGVLSVDAQRQRILGVPASLSRAARSSFLVLLAFLGLVEVATLLYALPGASLPGALLGGAGFTAVALVGGLAFARRRAVDEEERVLKRRVYRAHLELEADAARLAELRERLALDPADAAAEERLARLGREAPAGGLDHPEPGGVFAGRWEVGRLAGSGSFGLVYEARDRVTGARVVLKELRPDWRGSAEAAARLRREAELALRVAHPNLVRLLALERAAHGHVLVFERVDGETLRERLRRGPLGPAGAARLARDVAAALGALHAAGVLHRDVKPDNVLLRRDGSAVLLDLGSSADAQSSSTVLAGGGHPGTPDYMSPEQRRGEPLGPASDLYALALVVREALGPAPPPAWRAWLERALAEEPARRFADAETLAAALP